MVTASRDLERGLEEAGVPTEVARQIGEALDQRFAEVAAKEDVRNLREDFGHLREDIRHEIATFREDVRREIDNLRKDLDSRFDRANQITWRIFAVQSGLIAALLGAVIYALVR